MVCPRCRKAIPAGASRCPQCARSRPAPRPRASSPGPVLLIAGVLIAVGLGAAYLLSGKSAPEEAVETKPKVPGKRDPLAGLPEKVRSPKAQLGEDRDLYKTLDPGQTAGVPLKADRLLVAVFDVTPTDGSILTAAMTVQSTSTMTPSEDAALTRNLREVKKGTTSIVTCDANPRDVVGCFIRNGGAAPVTVRVRLRWWGLADPPPPSAEPAEANDERTEIKTIAPGRQIEMMIHASKRTQGYLEVTMQSGTVAVAMIQRRTTEDITAAEEKQIASQLQTVAEPGTWRKEYRSDAGDVHYCVIANPTDKPATFKLYHKTGAGIR